MTSQNSTHSISSLSSEPKLQSHLSTYDNTDESQSLQYLKTNNKSRKDPIKPDALVEENGRERLKRHRVEVAGRVWIPDIWGQEELLKDWIDCSAFDSSLVPGGIMSARAALAEEGRRANSSRLRIENRC